MDIKTILWPTDLSSHSLKAGEHVVSLAQKYGAEVILMYVAVDLCSYFPAYGNYPSPEHLNHFREWEIEKARKRLESICEEDLKACPFIKLQLVSGDPTVQILRMVEQAHADLIVISSRGQGAQSLDSADLGHVAHKIVHQSPVPVHLVTA